MMCIDPPPLTPDQLSAAIDGLAEAAVTDHLARCPYCTERLAAAQKMEHQLSARLDRWDCPTPQQLADFHFGLLDETAGVLRAHIAGCARCQGELAELAAFLADEALPAQPAAAPQPPAGRRLRDLVAQLLPRAPALVLRGEHRGPLIAQAGEVTLVLDVQAEGEQGLAVQGQLAAPDQDRWTGALAQLLDAGRVEQTSPVDDIGAFRFSGVAAVTWELRITPPAGPGFVLPALDLGGKARDR